MVASAVFEATFQTTVWQPSYLCMSELKQEITALLTKTERKKCKNTQKDIARWMSSTF